MMRRVRHSQESTSTWSRSRALTSVEEMVDRSNLRRCCLKMRLQHRIAQGIATKQTDYVFHLIRVPYTIVQCKLVLSNYKIC